MPLPVYLRLSEPDSDQITERPNNNEETNTLATGTPISSPVWYHDSWYGQCYDPIPEPYGCCFSDPEEYYDSDLEASSSPP
ncbi:hypothetical protein QBC32DRAFT_351749 [Pseudoneurospora amorphoporcata]|uniref:Uncharacterized protein n=1 Tax=Pseudoneurospora amorphoporcata TaxID=241081 RepID=A0AAN6NML1_9PEZI|nr:hypothetical protein QBC32DRAFT_351749 [Pseudoneurospora amorphoporcata]